MQLDLRLPLGMMFGLFGLILVAVGALGPASQTDCCMGININLEWGLVMMVFAAAMLLLAFRSKKEA
ncbi:MAG: hypothetical protein ACFUZC_09630 [Chthoniobacteraceae bacterium]